MNRKELRSLMNQVINEAIDRDKYPPRSFVDAMEKISKIANEALLNKSRNMPGKVSDDYYYQQILRVLRSTQDNHQLLPGEEYDVGHHGIGE